MITNSLKYRITLVGFVLQVAQAVVSLGKTLGLSIIGEGGEQPHHADALREWVCNKGQGFLYAHAVAPDQLHLLAPFRRKL